MIDVLWQAQAATGVKDIVEARYDERESVSGKQSEA